MDYIPKRDYMDYADNLQIGEQIHVNHTNCTAGEDNKRRLYIKRTDDGLTILAYCHNCGKHGSYCENNFGYATNKTRTSSTSSMDPNENNRGRKKNIGDFEQDSSKWRTEGRIWLSKYGITNAEISKYKLCYDNMDNALVLPVYRNGALLGWQSRNFDKSKPKYDTTTTEKPIWWYSGEYDDALQSSNSVALVEDVVSGIKCARYTPTIALLGTNLHDKLVSFVLDKVKNKEFVIFLDDDNRQVKLNQLKIKHKLEQLGYKVKLVTDVGKDPKECSDVELEKILL